jgi:cytoskeleton protein RodZ
MPPLDTGSGPHILRLVDPLDGRVAPSPGKFQSVGAYLRAMREHQGVSLNDLSALTRIRKLYLSAIEDGDLSSLPSRPFATGYVRAYAEALGLDGDLAAARFRTDFPDTTEPLRSPIGVKHEQRQRSPVIFVVVSVIVLGVVAWNISQRALAVGAAAKPSSGAAPIPVPAEPPAPGGPIALGAAQPPPADQTVPAPYITPGLGPAPQPVAAGAAAHKVLLTPVEKTPGGPSATFIPKGAVYGAPAGDATAIIQAHKAGSLIVRGPTGAVYFARQLVAGEAYRAPVGQGLTVEVTDPSLFQLYVNGQLRGSLGAIQTPLDKAAAAPNA